MEGFCLNKFKAITKKLIILVLLLSKETNDNERSESEVKIYFRKIYVLLQLFRVLLSFRSCEKY